MKAAIYARYSSDNQREESIEGQIRECMEYAEYNDIEIVGQYIDRAFSAKTDDRPDFLRMVNDSSKRLFDIVLVWKLDRFARNRYDSAFYRYNLRKNGVQVVSVKENISNGPEGIILEAMIEAMAEYYSANLAQNVKRGFKENALKGRWNGGAVPLGYTRRKSGIRGRARRSERRRYSTETRQVTRTSNRFNGREQRPFKTAYKIYG